MVTFGSFIAHLPYHLPHADQLVMCLIVTLISFSIRQCSLFTMCIHIITHALCAGCRHLFPFNLCTAVITMCCTAMHSTHTLCGFVDFISFSCTFQIKSTRLNLSVIKEKGLLCKRACLGRNSRKLPRRRFLSVPEYNFFQDSTGQNSLITISFAIMLSIYVYDSSH